MKDTFGKVLLVVLLICSVGELVLTLSDSKED